MPPMFSHDAFEAFMTAAVTEYQQSAPAVAAYLEDLYFRVNSGEGLPVLLDEIVAAQRLYMDGSFEHPNYAANAVYKLQHQLGRETTGLIGF